MESTGCNVCGRGHYHSSCTGDWLCATCDFWWSLGEVCARWPAVSEVAVRRLLKVILGHALTLASETEVAAR